MKPELPEMGNTPGKPAELYQRRPHLAFATSMRMLDRQQQSDTALADATEWGTTAPR